MNFDIESEAILLMAYNRYNSGYNNNRNRNNNYNYYNKNNNQNNRNPQHRNNNTFDATKAKKPDIEIIDLNGKKYKIRGNFSSAFSAEILKTIKEVDKIRKNNNDVETFPKMYKLLKSWCLSLINLNTEGVVYTMEDVDNGFDDIYVLYNLIAYISEVIGKNTATLKNNMANAAAALEQKTDKQ